MREVTDAECPSCGGKGTLTIDIGEYLRLARVVKGWSVREASKQTGLCHFTISRLEKGLHEPHRLTCIDLWEAYGLDVEEFQRMEFH